MCKQTSLAGRIDVSSFINVARDRQAVGSRIDRSPPGHPTSWCNGYIAWTLGSLNQRHLLIHRYISGLPGATHLFVDSLPAVLALLGMLDNGVRRQGRIEKGQRI